MARHLQRKHSSEKEGALALCHPEKSKQSRQMLEDLRRKGNNNNDVLNEGKGEIVAYRQPTEHVDPDGYLPCNICFDSSKELNYGNMRNCVVKQVSLKLSRSKGEEFKLLPRLFYHAKDNHHKGALRL